MLGWSHLAGADQFLQLVKANGLADIKLQQHQHRPAQHGFSGFDRDLCHDATSYLRKDEIESSCPARYLPSLTTVTVALIATNQIDSHVTNIFHLPIDSNPVSALLCAHHPRAQPRTANQPTGQPIPRVRTRPERCKLLAAQPSEPGSRQSNKCNVPGSSRCLPPWRSRIQWRQIVLLIKKSLEITPGIEPLYGTRDENLHLMEDGLQVPIDLRSDALIWRATGSDGAGGTDLRRL